MCGKTISVLRQFQFQSSLSIRAPFITYVAKVAHFPPIQYTTSHYSMSRFLSSIFFIIILLYMCISKFSIPAFEQNNIVQYRKNLR